MSESVKKEELKSCPNCNRKLHVIYRHQGVECKCCFNCGAKFRRIYDEQQFKSNKSLFIILKNYGGV